MSASQEGLHLKLSGSGSAYGQSSVPNVVAPRSDLMRCELCGCDDDHACAYENERGPVVVCSWALPNLCDFCVLFVEVDSSFEVLFDFSCVAALKFEQQRIFEEQFEPGGLLL